MYYSIAQPEVLAILKALHQVLCANAETPEVDSAKNSLTGRDARKKAPTAAREPTPIKKGLKV